jgi:hypothetical protein
MKYCIVFMLLLAASSCNKNEVEYNLEVDFSPAKTIHIICDARKTGKSEPWLLEFGNGGMRLDSPTVMIMARVGAVELDTAGPATVSYLGGMPLIELDSFIKVMPSYNFPDTNYKHYVFALNDRLQDKALFKVVNNSTRRYGYVEAAQNYVNVYLSTNDTLLSRAVQRCNDFLTDSMLGQRRFTVTH